MSDHPKSPKNPFNFHAKDDQAPKKEADQNRDDEGKNLDWRQNTPNKNLPSPPELSLSKKNKNSQGSQSLDEGVTIIFDQEKEPMEWWRKIDGKEATKDGYAFELTLKEDEESITLGKSDIDHLRLIKDDEFVAEFKGGWVDLPQSDRDWEEIERLEEMFTNTERKFYSIDSDPDKGQDRDR